MIMEADKSHNLSILQTGEQGEASNVFQSQSEGVKNQWADDAESWPELEVPMSKGRRRWMSQIKKREQICPSCDFFVLVRPTVGWMIPTHISEGNLYSVY